MARLCQSRGDKMMDVVKEGVKWQYFVMSEGTR